MVQAVMDRKTYESANDYLNQHMRVGFVSRRVRSEFVRNWVELRSSGLTDAGATREALADTKREYGNPLMWWAVAWVLQYVVVPLLIRWWNNR